MQNSVWKREFSTSTPRAEHGNPSKWHQKNPTYSDRVFCGGEAGICFTAERKNEVLRTERAAGGDRVRQRCCPVQSTEIPRNDIKKTRPIRIGFFVAEKQGFEPWLRFTRTTPLAGEPLRPLGYFSIAELLFQSLDIISHRFASCQWFYQQNKRQDYCILHITPLFSAE